MRRSREATHMTLGTNGGGTGERQLRRAVYRMHAHSVVSIPYDEQPQRSRGLAILQQPIRAARLTRPAPPLPRGGVTRQGKQTSRIKRSSADWLRRKICSAPPSEDKARIRVSRHDARVAVVLGG